MAYNYGAAPKLRGSSGVTSGFLGADTREQKLVKASALKRENVSDVLDDCIVHARDGDDFFNDPKFRDFVDMLKGYVIIPVEEYNKLGG